jgi:hypothetical protein
MAGARGLSGAQAPKSKDKEKLQDADNNKASTARLLTITIWHLIDIVRMIQQVLQKLGFYFHKLTS